jgi:TonB family protein
MTPDSGRSPVASGVRSLLIGSAALAAIVVVSVATATLYRARPFADSSRRHSAGRTAASGPGLGLRAEVRGGNLQVTWNREVAPVRNATSGSLTFQDGETRKTLQLNQAAARAGAVFYAAQGTQVQVALTIFAPDHVASESISAAMPAAAMRSPLLPAADAGSEVLVPARDREESVANLRAEPEARASQATAAARTPGLPKPDRASRPVTRDHAVAAGNSTEPASSPEEPAATVTPSPELAAPGSGPGLAPGTVAIRVEVDESGRVVGAVLIPQKNVDPEFAEAALQMARDWRFEAPRAAANQHTIRVLQFRQSLNR